MRQSSEKPKRSKTSLLSIVVLLLHAATFQHVNAQETYTSDIYSAWVGQHSPLLEVYGGINVFLTDEAIAHGVFGVNGVVYGLPSNATGGHVVIHESYDCEDRGVALSYWKGQRLNETVFIDSGAAFLEFTSEFDFEASDISGRVVAVYLDDGTLAGCGNLNPEPDSYVLEAQLNALPNVEGFQSEITMLVVDDSPTICFFGVAAGLEPTLRGGNCNGTAIENQCGLKIRSQTTCEEDLMQPTVIDSSKSFDPWDWSRYYWSNEAGFGAFTTCVDVGWVDDEHDRRIERLVGNAFLAYNSLGDAVGCGFVQPYSPPREELYQSNVFWAYLNQYGLDEVYGVVFVFQNTHTIRTGVIGIAGHGYNFVECETSDACELVLYDASEQPCEGELGDPIRRGKLTFDRDGSFYGTLDLLDTDVDSMIATIHSPDGTIVSCDWLDGAPDSTVYQTKTSTYPNRDGIAEVTLSSVYEDELCSFGVVYGLESNLEDCFGACNYHVNKGMSCDQQSDHIFNKNDYDDSPWRNTRYTQTNENGIAHFGGCVETRLTDYDYSGHSLVIRGPDNLPSSCGILVDFDPSLESGEMCSVCPLDGYKMTKPDGFVNLGGPSDITCEMLQTYAESPLFSPSDCLQAQQVAMGSCGCAQSGKVSESSSQPPTALIAVAVAAVLIVLGLAFWIYCRKGPRSPQDKKAIGDLALEQQQATPAPQQQISESLVSRQQQIAPVSSPVATPVPTANSSSSSTPLTSKNQLHGDSFWQANNAVATPYAQVVSVEPSHERQVHDSKTSTSTTTGKVEESADGFLSF